MSIGSEASISRISAIYLKSPCLCSDCVFVEKKTNDSKVNSLLQHDALDSIRASLHFTSQTLNKRNRIQTNTPLDIQSSRVLKSPRRYSANRHHPPSNHPPLPPASRTPTLRYTASTAPFPSSSPRDTLPRSHDSPDPTPHPLPLFSSPTFVSYASYRRKLPQYTASKLTSNSRDKYSASALNVFPSAYFSPPPRFPTFRSVT